MIKRQPTRTRYRDYRTKKFLIRLDPEVAERFKTECKKQDCSYSYLIQQLLKEKLKR